MGKSKVENGFVGFYAVFMLIFVVMFLEYIFILSPIAPLSHIHAKTQLEVYAKNAYDFRLVCLRDLGVGECGLLEMEFEKGYKVSVRLHAIEDSLYLLDITSSVKNPVTSNTQRVVRRHVLSRLQ